MGRGRGLFGDGEGFGLLHAISEEILQSGRSGGIDGLYLEAGAARIHLLERRRK